MESHSSLNKRPEVCKLQDEESLKSESKSWSADQWEAYLQSVEVGLAEAQPSRCEVERKAIAANIFDITNSSCSEELSTVVENLLSKLSERQAFVMRKIFWEGRSERQIARSLGVSRQAVYDLKKRALKNLRKHALGVLAISPIVEAQASEVPHMQLNTGETPAA